MPIVKVSPEFRRRKFLGTWYDIILKSIFLLFLYMTFLYFGLQIANVGKIEFLGTTISIASRNFAEIGLGVIGVSTSVAAVSALSIAKVGMERKVGIRRCVAAHCAFLRACIGGGQSVISVVDGKQISSAFLSGHLRFSEFVLDCSPDSHRAFESLRVAAVILATDEVDVQASLKNFLISLLEFCCFAGGNVEIPPGPLEEPRFDAS